MDIQIQKDYLYKTIGEQYIQLLILKDNFVKINKELEELKKLKLAKSTELKEV